MMEELFVDFMSMSIKYYSLLDGRFLDIMATSFLLSLFVLGGISRDELFHDPKTALVLFPFAVVSAGIILCAVYSAPFLLPIILLLAVVFIGAISLNP